MQWPQALEVKKKEPANKSLCFFRDNPPGLTSPSKVHPMHHQRSLPFTRSAQVHPAHLGEDDGGVTGAEVRVVKARVLPTAIAAQRADAGGKKPWAAT